MERRTLIALALSFLIIIFYPQVLRIFYPEYGKKPALSATAVPGLPAGQAGAPAPAFSPTSVEPLPSGGTPEKTSDIEAGPYQITVSEDAGSFVKVSFPAYQDPARGTPLIFLDTPEGSWGVGASWLQVNGKARETAFRTEIEGTRIKAEASGEGFRLSKEFDIHNSNYANRLSIKYSNTSGETQVLRLQILAGSGLTAKNNIDKQYFEANWIEEKRVDHLKPLSEGKTKISERPYSAVSIKDRHFSSILKPAGGLYTVASQGLAKENFGSYIMFEAEVPAGQSWSESFILYIGPNRAEALRSFGLEPVIHFGKLDGICKVLLGTLELLRGVVRNYGVAIILLTLGINVLLFPLTRASLMSMKRMQLVQPQTVKIREKYGKDPARMNKEMMELYRKYKVNPMGGCLPMVLQMPVFISLYVALSKSVDLLGARFLWIDNLSYPDVVPLPLSLPLVGNTLHILPLIMVGAMVFQQRVSQSRTPPSADPNMAQQQKIMTTMMPIFFGFIFYPMPSGLVIYWLTNTAVMTFVQFFLLKTPEPAVD